MATQHPEEIIPHDLFSQIHISFKEADLMKVGAEEVRSYWEAHDMPNSDDLVEEIVGEKRACASSASSVGGTRKSGRYQ